ncbi:MAG: hypothetical protein J5J00_14045 [Deltaproteobacteria bacterium]|nr:hypothetical protein [Deltaproteobacteria bacterium]
MKVTLDLSQLLADGEISAAEYEKLLKLSSATTGSLAFNILIAFGVVAVSGGLLALFPTPQTSLFLGIAICLLGLTLGIISPERWNILSNISTLIGALLFAGGVLALAEGSIESFFMVAAIFIIGGISAKSGLLISLAVLALSSTVGARTGYFHASYFLGIKEPGLTLVIFSALAVATYLGSKSLKPAYERLALIASRTCVLLVNFAFWIGSLWGDRGDKGAILISDTSFSVGWAAALLLAGVWGAYSNRRWMVNTAAVFGSIHFYTQWFESLGASPLAIMLAGVIAIAGALGLRKLNSQLRVAAGGV